MLANFGLHTESHIAKWLGIYYTQVPNNYLYQTYVVSTRVLFFTHPFTKSTHKKNLIIQHTKRKHSNTKHVTFQLIHIHTTSSYFIYKLVPQHTRHDRLPSQRPTPCLFQILYVQLVRSFHLGPVGP